MPRRANRVMILTCSRSRSSGRSAARVGRDHGFDAGFLIFVDQPWANGGQAFGEGLAIVAAEQEIDGREHLAGGKLVDDLARKRFVHAGSVLLRTSALAGAPADLPPRFAARVREVAMTSPFGVDHQMQFGIDEVVERQRHGPFVVRHQTDGAMGAADPGGDLGGIRNRRREAHELNVLRAEDDRLFPGGAALRVGQVMDLVEDDAVDIVDIPWGLQQHVAQHLGGHHEDLGVGVLGHVAGEQADLRRHRCWRRSRNFWLDSALIGVV